MSEFGQLHVIQVERQKFEFARLIGEGQSDLQFEIATVPMQHIRWFKGPADDSFSLFHALTMLGLEGWQLVNVSGATMWFQRRIVDEVPRITKTRSEHDDVADADALARSTLDGQAWTAEAPIAFSFADKLFPPKSGYDLQDAVKVVSSAVPDAPAGTLEVWWWNIRMDQSNSMGATQRFRVANVDEAVSKIKELIDAELSDTNIATNAGGLEVFEDKIGWTEWEDENGDNIWEMVDSRD